MFTSLKIIALAVVLTATAASADTRVVKITLNQPGIRVDLVNDGPLQEQLYRVDLQERGHGQAWQTVESQLTSQVIGAKGRAALTLAPHAVAGYELRAVVTTRDGTSLASQPWNMASKSEDLAGL